MNRATLSRVKQLLRGTTPTRSPKLQEHYFRQSLAEVGIWGGEIKIDHLTGRSHHAETGWVPLVFPECLISFVGELPRRKATDHFFRGMIYGGREWVQKYDGTAASDYGRDAARKYTIDRNYYENLSRSRFGLAPTGDCPWSYRFFEAIMCHAIPVLGAMDHDVFGEAFHHYRDGDTLLFRQDWCDENHQRLVSRHTLRGLQAS